MRTRAQERAEADDPVDAPALVVPVRDGETARQRLLQEDLLRVDLRPRKDGDELLFPLARDPGDAWDGHPVRRAAFQPQRAPPPPWQDLAARHVPPELRPLLPVACDQLGHVVILKLVAELAPFERAIGEAILATVKRARTVAVDEGVTGELRVRALRVIAGEPGTLTEHVEHGVRVRVDPARAYYSPRLAFERKRVADLVQPGERVVDLMGGVAPFALVIAKHARPARVDSVDLNADAIALARENVTRNRAESVVFPAHADAREWARAHAGVADRVITNLPHGAHAFAEDAWRVLKDAGTWHYHAIIAGDALTEHVDALRERARAVGRALALDAQREVRTYSPTEKHYALDFTVTRA